MAYNNYYPVSYQPMYQMPQQQTQSTGIIWVQGEAGAKAYPVAPNNTVQLWDSEAQTIYLKSSDASGLPTMKVLDYTVRDGGKQNELLQKPQIDMSGYITRDEFEKRLAEIRKVKDESDI